MIKIWHLFILLCFFSFFCSCSADINTINPETVASAEIVFDQKTADRILDISLDSLEETSLTESEKIKRILKSLGKEGYVSVDSKNQINMTCAEQAVQFCQAVDEKEDAALTITVVSEPIGLTIYDLHCTDGRVSVARNIYQYQNHHMVLEDTAQYFPNDWKYTKDGYILFSGDWYSEEYYLFTLSNMQEKVALRVLPLDEKCRQMNADYIAPIGYAKNNLFSSEWNENNFSEIDFYDLFDVFYRRIYGKDVPYIPDDNLGIGAIYQISKTEFETPIMTFMDIDDKTIQQETIYHADTETYEYRPRGFFDAAYPEYPYPEVVDYTENIDGTITLLVNVVFPYENNSCVYSHEVVVRPMADGGVQYVSNHILPSENNAEITWYKPRLTLDEWASVYGIESTDDIS